jgi:uncharacterized membrane protein YuzA (DUF378 family)
MTMQSTKLDIKNKIKTNIKVNYVFYIFASLIGLMQIYSALNVRWSDSELWSLSIAHITFSSTIDQSFFYKPLFMLINWLLTGLSANIYFDDAFVIQFSRLFYCLVGLFGAWTFLKFAKLKSSKSKVKHSDVITLLVLVSSSLFLFQGFRIRSDLLASVMCFFGLYLLEKSNWSKWTLPTVLHVLAILVTPKAVLFLAANFVYVFLAHPKKLKSLNVDKIILVITLPIIAALLAFTYYPYGYSGAWKYLLSTFSEGVMRPSPWSLAAYSNLLNFLIDSAHLVLAFVGCVWFYIRYGPKDKALTVTAGFCILLILIFPDRLPFFILSMLWLPLLWLNKYFLLLLERFKKIQIYALTVLIFCGGLFWLQLNGKNSNIEQKTALQILNGVIGRSPKISYYDATGAMPTRTKYDVFPAPEQDANEKNVLRLLSGDKVNLVFFGQRLFFYFQSAMRALEDNFFVDVGGGVFAKSMIIDIKLKRIVGGMSIAEICSVAEHGVIHLRAGSSFLKLKPLKGKMLCSEAVQNDKTPIRIINEGSKWMAMEKRKDEFLVLTFVEDFVLPSQQSFAQLFDDDSHFNVGYAKQIFY